MKKLILFFCFLPCLIQAQQGVDIVEAFTYNFPYYLESQLIKQGYTKILDLDDLSPYIEESPTMKIFCQIDQHGDTLRVAMISDNETIYDRKRELSIDFDNAVREKFFDYIVSMRSYYPIDKTLDKENSFSWTHVFAIPNTPFYIGYTEYKKVAKNCGRIIIGTRNSFTN